MGQHRSDSCSTSFLTPSGLKRPTVKSHEPLRAKGRRNLGKMWGRLNILPQHFLGRTAAFWRVGNRERRSGMEESEPSLSVKPVPT